MHTNEAIRLECELFALRWIKERKQPNNSPTINEMKQKQRNFAVSPRKSYILKKYINQLIHIFLLARCNH